MKLRISFDVDVDLEGHGYFLARYNPDFNGETPAVTLAREAIAAWELEGLLVHDGPDDPPYTVEVLES